MDDREERKNYMDEKTALNLLELALRNVPICYILDWEPWKDKLILQVERSFGYELYHQWRKLIDDYYDVHKDSEKVFLQGEISKEIIELFERKPEDSEKETHWFPDFVLHSGQHSLENQLLVCEIKRFVQDKPDESAISKDLLKLSIYVNRMKTKNNKGNFKIGIFIYFAKSKNEIHENLVNILNNFKSHERENYELLKHSLSKIYIYSVFPSSFDSFCDFERIYLKNISII